MVKGSSVIANDTLMVKSTRCYSKSGNFISSVSSSPKAEEGKINQQGSECKLKIASAEEGL